MHCTGSLLEQTPSSSRLAAPTLARYSRKLIGWKTAVRPTMFPSFAGYDSDQDCSLALAARLGNTRAVRVRGMTSNPWPRGVPIGATGARAKAYGRPSPAVQLACSWELGPVSSGSRSVRAVLPHAQVGVPWFPTLPPRTSR